MASDKFDWTRQKGQTPSPNTGPSYDHTSGEGYYIYLDGNAANRGDATHLASPICTSPTPHCFRFWYHMYGVAQTMALRVYAVFDRASPELIWTQSGNKGNKWLRAEVSVPHREDVQIILEGVRGEDFRSDVAVDDITIEEGYCPGYTPPPPTTVSSAATTSTSSPTPPSKEETTASSTLLSSIPTTIPTSSPAPPTTEETTASSTLLSSIPTTIRTSSPAPPTTEETTASPTLLSSIPTTIPTSSPAPPTTEETTASSTLLSSIPTTIPTSSPAPPTTDSSGHCDFSCSFDVDFCSWTQSIFDRFDWIRHKGPTSTSETGPSSDHTSGEGYYIYVEGDSSTPGEVAHLVSPSCNATGPQCFHFWYHMYGVAKRMALRVYVVSKGTPPAVVWTQTGNKGNQWHRADVNMDYKGKLQIIFEGVRGEDFRNDLAVDDVSIEQGRCPEETSLSPTAVSSITTTIHTSRNNPSSPSTALPFTTPPGTITPVNTADPTGHCDFSCSFDVDFCSWKQLASDKFHWRRHKGSTPSPNTGPSYDHTSGEGYYIYLEGNDANRGEVAHLVSPSCSSPRPHCFRFWYHMYGVAQTMALRVYAVFDRASPELIWTQSGNKGNKWLRAEVSVPHREDVQIILEGVCGEDFRSDVAVDDITIEEGYCPGDTPAVPTTSSSPTTAAPMTTAVITASSPAPPTTDSCLVSGDPHYYTFDRQTHHFMGNCTYTLSQLCDPKSSLPYFNVEAANEHRWGNTQVSYVQSVDVDVLGIRVTLEKGGGAKVNGKQAIVPSTPTAGVQILPSGFYTVVSTDFGVRVKFDGDHQVEVSLPSPYRGRVCGMCGNYNGDPTDDFLNPRGEPETDSTSLGNSWQVSNHTRCSSGPDPVCTEAEKEAAQSSSFCGLITDVTGPFRHCHSALDPTGPFTGCLYDQCALHLDPGSLCKSLQSYADACRSLGVAVQPWRNATFCPISCPPNSHYEPCVSACPASCADPVAPATCSLPCTEACACDSGFLLYNGACVPSQQCGCWHQGKHYPVGSEFWTDDTCSSKCTCPSRGSQLICSGASCPEDHYCGVQQGVPGCYAYTYGVCRVHNDPHYNTFDKQTHHFMGNCTYTLAKVCANATGLPSFRIEAKNEHRWGNPSVSYVQRVLVQVFGQKIEILKNHPSQVLVNKIWTTLPVQRLNGSVSVGRNGRYVTLETNFRLSVSYDTDHSVEIRVPSAYFNRTCGMCGNFNNRWQDDYMMPNGHQAKDSNELGTSWQVQGAEYDLPGCGVVLPPQPCTPEQMDLYGTDAFCGLLTSSQGPFAVCLSVINPLSFFESCVFDLCALNGNQELLCNALETYADACQRAGVDLPGWRNATFCPLPCPPNSHYKLCTSPCPATCSKPLAPEHCSEHCVEGCECKEGFVLSGGQCVSAEDCGCLAGDDYYEKGENFWQSDCLGRCHCAGNGSLVCNAETCQRGQICKVQNGILGCHVPDTATCHIYGDPHYTTFDGRLYHFQGACNYTAVETCTNASEQFSVTTRNEHRGSEAWTALNSVAVSFQNLHVALRKNKEVYVNGARVDLPMDLRLGIRVEERPPYVVVASPFGFLAKFDGDQELFVQVDERYKGHLCGLCGTYSGSQLDDFQRPDKILEHDPNEFGNSWAVTDDLWTCEPSTVPPPCDPALEAGFEDLCKVVLATGGPCEACHRSIPPQLYFESCVYDQCATGGDTGQFCKSLEAYAAACTMAGVDLGDWTKDTACDPTKPTLPPSPVPPASTSSLPSDSEATSRPLTTPGTQPLPTGQVTSEEPPPETKSTPLPETTAATAETTAGPAEPTLPPSPVPPASTTSLPTKSEATSRPETTPGNHPLPSDAYTASSPPTATPEPTPPFTAPPGTVTPVNTADPTGHCDFSCSFDEDFCSWRQMASDKFDWTRQKGQTPSPNTGPSYDHTSGEGYYIYLDGNAANRGDATHLASPICTSPTPHCFRFWYHMYGVAQTMALRVYAVFDRASPELIWTQSGNKGNKWLRAEVSVPHREDVQIILEGVRGEDFRSDVAVDDITIEEGYCPGYTPPPPTTVSSAATTSTSSPTPPSKEETTASSTLLSSIPTTIPTSSPAPPTTEETTASSTLLSSIPTTIRTSSPAPPTT
ncbi:IgGFc-binding protein-like, partial [Rhineura floridana]|uniref:IgGFc-binding protein-like n=1 Tax=Rhineura floridana TaxID=261503 RepID=UPI002AC87CDF